MPFGSAIALRDALRAGEISAVEAANHFLARIESRADLGAFVTVTAESTLEEARAADRSLAAHRSDPGAPLPPLLGLPLAHKDLVDVAGVPTTRGSAAIHPAIPAVDHPVVAALRAAGTVSLGKTQVPEFGLTGYSENLIAPPARNPHDPRLTPGGSSGGSAAAVSAGLLPIAPGSDGGGSIRIPALACGLVGLKPGLGAVPGDVAAGFVDDFGGPRLTVHGPLARTAEDAAMLMDALAPGASPAPHAEAVRRAADLTGLSIGVSEASPWSSVYDIALSPESRRAFETAAADLAALGHRVEAADFAYDPDYPEFFTGGWTSGLSLLELAPEDEDRLTPLTREFRERALARSAAQHRATARRLKRFAVEARAMWGRYDVVLTPGLAFDPPRVGEFLALPPSEDYRLQCLWAPYTSMVNVSGLPAIAVPMRVGHGASASALPMGVQLIGRAGSEPQLLALAAQLASLP